jgi:site-specific DNA recombinase
MSCYTFLYTRKSHEENDRQILSLDAQDKECRLLAERHRIPIDQVVREAHSARRPGRPLFAAMLQEAEARLKRHTSVRILSHKPDRLLRNIADWARLNDLTDAGLELLFVTGSYDNNAQGKLAFGINVVFAKYYVDNLSEEVKKGIREKLARGEWPGWAPLGYQNLNDKSTGERISVDPVRGPLVRRAFELYATGEYSLASLTHQMAEEGLVGRLTKKPLSKSILRDRILANPFYYGAFRYRGELHPGSHQPLVSLALFEQVQAVLQGKGRPKRFRHEFRYGGLLHCTRCHCAVVGDIKQGRYIYYRCSHRRGPCPEGYIRQEALAGLIGTQVAPVLRLRPGVDASLREAAEQIATDGNDRDAEQAGLERRLAELDRQAAILLDLRLAESVSDEQYMTKKDAVTREQLRVREKLATFEIPGVDPRQAVDWFVATCNGLGEVLDSGTDTEVRELLRIVGSNYRLGGGTVDFEPVEPFTIAAQAQNRPTWRAEQADVRHLVTYFQALHEALSASSPESLPAT